MSVSFSYGLMVFNQSATQSKRFRLMGMGGVLTMNAANVKYSLMICSNLDYIIFRKMVGFMSLRTSNFKVVG